MYRVLAFLLLFSTISCASSSKSSICDLSISAKKTAWSKIVAALKENDPNASRYYDLTVDPISVRFYDYGDVCRVYPNPSKAPDAIMTFDGDIGVEVLKETLEVTAIFPVVCCKM